LPIGINPLDRIDVKEYSFFMRRFFFFIILVFLSFDSLFAVQSTVILQESDIIWEMAPLFGLDQNNDGRIDIPNSFSYMHPRGVSIRFFLSDRFLLSLGDSKVSRFSVLIDGEDEEILETLPSGVEVANIPEGEHLISCSFFVDTTLYHTELTVHPRFIRMASIGDSYSSGEGIPEFRYTRKNPSIWADGGPNSTAIIDHTKAHRSSFAWPVQSALFLEREDSHSSVLFTFLPASGAEIDKGLIVKYKGIDPSLGGRYLPPQVDQLSEIMGGDSIDYLFIGIGGNDLAIVRAATFGVLFESSPIVPFEKKYKRNIEAIIKSVQTGYWDFPVATLFGYKNVRRRAGLNGLSERYIALNKEIKEKLVVDTILLVGYPIPMLSGDIVLDDFFPGFELDGEESGIMVAEIFLPLLKVMQESALALGWEWVPVHTAYDYSTHTYPNKEPYSPEMYGKEFYKYPLRWDQFKRDILTNPVRWFRTAQEAVLIQGAGVDLEKPWALSTTGTIHPNEFSHQAVMHQVLKSIHLKEWFPSGFQQEYISEEEPFNCKLASD